MGRRSWRDGKVLRVAGVVVMIVLSAGLVADETDADLLLRWPLPADSGRVGHTVGPGVDPRTGELVFHSELELSVLIGSPLRCPFAGTVIVAGFRNTGGPGRVVMSHAGGRVLTVYDGLMTVDVSVGDSLAVGSPLGRIGVDTDSDTGAIRIQVWVDGELTDPMDIMSSIPPDVLSAYERDAAAIERRVRQLTTP